VILPTAKLGGGLLRLALKESPLVVVVLIAVFLSAETWQFFARLDGAQYVKVMAGFLFVIVLILIVGLREEWTAAFTIHDEEPSDVERPLADAGFGEPPQGLTAPGASRWVVGGTQVARLVIESAFVGAVAASLFVVLGAIGLSPELTSSWTSLAGEKAHHVNELGRIPLLGKHAEPLTTELIHVAGALGAIAALSFTVEIVTGERLRSELLRQRFAGYRSAFRAWARLYHGKPPATEPSPAPR
jgi:hypothetical protein